MSTPKGINERFKGVVFCCSGGSDVGEVSDRIAREFSKLTGMRLLCTAALATNQKETTELVKTADIVVCIDGCKNSCTQKLLKLKGMKVDHLIQLGEFGMDKGRSHPSKVRIELGLSMALETMGLK